MSFTAHKIYGPKGIGALYVRSREPRVRLEPQIDGGGQEGGLRSGTANVPGIVGFARALDLCLEELPAEAVRLAGLARPTLHGTDSRRRRRIAERSRARSARARLPGNLNVSFGLVEGEAVMLEMREIALSSGIACTSAQPEPSHVLRRWAFRKTPSAAACDSALAVSRLRKKLSSLSPARWKASAVCGR